MVIAADKQAGELETLKAKLAEAVAEKDALAAELRSTKHQLHTIIEKLSLERLRAYGPSSEKSPDQISLFDEAETEASADSDADVGDAAADDLPDTGDAAAPAPRKRPARKPLPADLPRVRVVHELSEADRQCPCGCTMVEIGEKTSEQLDGRA